MAGNQRAGTTLEDGPEARQIDPEQRVDDQAQDQQSAELDAYYARLYGLTRDELRYILDPKEVHGEDFPGETFRLLKEKEIRLYSEDRTRRLVLKAWDAYRPRLASGKPRARKVEATPFSLTQWVDVWTAHPF